MTREEFDKVFENLLGNRDDKIALLTCGEYITSLEQRIAELEAPKTCEGCEYYNNRYPYCDHAECSRLPTLFDYYEPKKQK